MFSMHFDAFCMFFFFFLKIERENYLLLVLVIPFLFCYALVKHEKNSPKTFQLYISMICTSIRKDDTKCFSSFESYPHSKTTDASIGLATHGVFSRVAKWFVVESSHK